MQRDVSAGDAHRNHVVCVTASANGVDAALSLLSRLPLDFPAPILYQQQVPPSFANVLSDVLEERLALPVQWARDGEEIRNGAVYLCPAEHRFSLRYDGRIGLVWIGGHTVYPHVSAPDPFLDSAAAVHQDRVFAVVIGNGTECADGIRGVLSRNGIVLVADDPRVPLRALHSAEGLRGQARMLAPDAIAPTLVSVVRDTHALGDLPELEPSPFPRLASSAPLRHALDRLLHVATWFCDTDLGHVQFVDGKDSLTLVAQKGFPLGFCSHFRTLPTTDGACCAQAVRCGPVVVKDVLREQAFAAHAATAAAARVRGACSLPLTARGGRVFGVGSVFFRQAHKVAERELGILAVHVRDAAARIEALLVS